MDALVDVIEVEIAPPHRIRIMARSETKDNAEAIVKMAVIRRGVERHFFTTAPSNRYQDGDTLAVPDEIAITPAMVEAGEDVILGVVGGADLGGLFSASDLARRVFEAMERCRSSEARASANTPKNLVS